MGSWPARRAGRHVRLHPGGVRPAVLPDDLHRHEARAPAHPRDSGPVVADRGGQTRDVGPVAVLVHRRRIRLGIIHPCHQLALQVRVLQIDAGVENGDDDPVGAGGHVPGVGNPHLWQVPLPPGEELVGRRLRQGMIQGVHNRILHAGLTFEALLAGILEGAIARGAGF